jgi:V/A-type H+-transporting ATPase subunit E
MLLKAKNQLIDEVVEMALKRVRDLQGDDYLSLVKKLILKHSLKGEGVLRFSEKDLPRITDTFLNKVNSMLKEDGKHVVKGESIDIKDGFVIEYRDVDINCTFEALIKGMEEEIREQVYRVLFQEDNE